MDRIFYQKNRAEFEKLLNPGDLAVFFAGKSLRKSADEDYPFYANRNFLYLTGITQVESVLLIEKTREGECLETLFMLPKDEAAEVWTGRRMSKDEIEAVSTIADIMPVDSLEANLHRRLAGGNRSVYLCLDRLTPWQTMDLEHTFAEKLRENYPAIRIYNAYEALCAMRRIKTPEEIEAIETAMKLTNRGIRRMMRNVRPGMMEYALEAEFLHELGTAGERDPAFPCIISAGTRNFYLHYPQPKARIEDGDLVLTDVGAPFDEYHTDISRVFPANGRFSRRQAQVYEIALNANREIMKAIRPGQPFSMNNRLCRELCFEGLKKLGLIDDFAEIGRYVWHGVTHHVGLDTHDVGGYEMPMAENMVFCVDAGIYIREWGIGLRVEDDVVVTKDGCRNLSADIPAEVDEIEALMAQ